MKRSFTVLILLVCLSIGTAFAQTTNATLGGTVSDASRALIPGVTVTATNTQTGIVSTSVTNETGAYNFPSLQTGTYKVSAELAGFSDADLQRRHVGRLAAGAFELHACRSAGRAQAVEVNVAADTLIATTSSSVGTVLPEYKVRDLPLAYAEHSRPGRNGVGNAGQQFCGRTLDAAQYDSRWHSRQRRTLRHRRRDDNLRQPRSCRRSARHRRACGCGDRTRLRPDSDDDAVRNQPASRQPVLGEPQLGAERQLLEQQLPGRRQRTITTAISLAAASADRSSRTRRSSFSCLMASDFSRRATSPERC